MSKGKKTTLQVENLGPITKANVELGDLTVLVGPQGSGKGIFLQTLKLAMDRNHILGFFEQCNIKFNYESESMLSGYYGRGMGGMLNKEPTVRWEGKKYKLEQFARFKMPKNKQVEKLFYIPSQRVVSIPSGISQSFNGFRYGDPYVLRYFADKINVMLQSEFGNSKSIFPAEGRLSKALQESIANNILDGAELRLEPIQFTSALTLKVKELSEGLSYLAWSAGQREFVPLLLGFYWLCPVGKTARRNQIEWVVIEEPEMGLHSQGIETFLLLVLELMRRGYKVVISTHSTQVLDLVRLMREVKEGKGKESDVRRLFKLESNTATQSIAKSALKKDCCIYFFEHGRNAHDTSA